MAIGRSRLLRSGQSQSLESKSVAGLMGDDLGSRIEMPSLGLGSDIVAYIGGGAGAFLLEYTCSGPEEVGRFSPCIMLCESFELETREGKEGGGRLRRNRSMSFSSKKALSP